MLPNCIDHYVSRSYYGLFVQGWVPRGWGADWRDFGFGVRRFAVNTHRSKVVPPLLASAFGYQWGTNYTNPTF